jgi:hypothetical protein
MGDSSESTRKLGFQVVDLEDIHDLHGTPSPGDTGTRQSLC